MGAQFLTVREDIHKCGMRKARKNPSVFDWNEESSINQGFIMHIIIYMYTEGHK